MAQKCWNAEVFIVNNESQFVPKFANNTTQVRADYDPLGLSIKITDGKYQNKNKRQLLFCY